MRPVTAEQVGQGIRCRECRAEYPAAVSETDHTAERFVAHVRGKIRKAGENLTVVGVLGGLLTAMGLAVIGVQVATAFEDIRDRPGNALLGFGCLVGNLLLNGVVMYGGACISRVRNYPLCVLAAALAMLPVVSVCFPIGLAYGLIALYWLRKPEVRWAFTLNRPDPDV